LYRLCDGTTTNIKVDKKYYANKPLSKYDMISIGDMEQKHKRKKVDGKWVMSDETEIILNSYARVVIEDEG